jgi:hypothetical protein
LIDYIKKDAQHTFGHPFLFLPMIAQGQAIADQVGGRHHILQ